MIPRAPGLRLAPGQELGHSYDAVPVALRRSLRYDREAVGEKRRSIAMTAIMRIARRMAGVVEEMNYAQRRKMELFLGLDQNRR